MVRGQLRGLRVLAARAPGRRGRAPAPHHLQEARPRLSGTPLHRDRRRADSFGLQAERYDRARPRYPDALYDAILAGGVRDVLDVGCGTGIVARQLAARGCRVLGVEPDPRMAEIGRRRGTEVEVAAVEDWDPRGRTFDLVTAGQAWHWVEPVRGTATVARALRPGGRVALFWNFAELEPEAAAALDAAYRRAGLDLDPYAVMLGQAGEDRVREASAALSAHGGFGPPEVRRFPWAHRYTTAEWLDQLPTHSDHTTLEPDRLAALLEAIRAVLDARGGVLPVDYTTWLVSSRILRAWPT